MRLIGVDECFRQENHTIPLGLDAMLFTGQPHLLTRCSSVGSNMQGDLGGSYYRMGGFAQGVMISHSAVISEVAGLHAFLKQISYGSTITEGDVVLSYLPLAHIFDRCALSDPRRAHSWSSYEMNCPLRKGARLLLHQLPWKATSCHLLATFAWTKQSKSCGSRRW